MRRSQSSRDLETAPTEARRLSLGVSEAGPTGVGGLAGTKKAGTQQTVDLKSCVSGLS